MRDRSNPKNRFEATHLELDPGEAMPAELVVLEEQAKSIVSANDSPDLSFRYSANAYRGCFHACAYCYARPTHPYLGFGAGTDFDRRIVVKRNAPELLREAFDHPRWRGETVVFSGNTDPYQPLESRYGLTRRMLEVCRDYRNPVAVITKGLAIRRDVDLLVELHRVARVVVTISCAFASDDDARRLEPSAPPPSKRMALMRELHDAGVPVAVSLAPTIPGINDSQIPEALRRAKDAGAQMAFHTMLRLPGEVAQVFEERVREAYPDRAEKVMNGVRAMRDGALHDPRFGARMTGTGERFRAIAQLFDVHARRLGLLDHRFAFDDAQSTFRRPIVPKAQLDLFGIEQSTPSRSVPPSSGDPHHTEGFVHPRVLPD